MPYLRSLLTTISFKARLLILLLGITALVVITNAAMAVNTVQQTGWNAQQLGSVALREQAQEYLLQLTQSSARENELFLEKITGDAQKTAAFIASVFDHPPDLNSQDLRKARVELISGPEGQHFNLPSETSSLFVPSMKVLDETTLRDVELSAYLDLLFDPIFKNNPNVEAIYFATPRDVVRYYPNINLGVVLPADFRASERVWYTGSTLAENPGRAAWWTPVYVDATGLGLVTTAAVPVYNQQEELVGVVGFDVTLNEMKAKIETTRLLSSGYSFLIDKTGQAIALPEKGYPDIRGRSSAPDDTDINLSQINSAFSPIINSMMNGESGFEVVVVNEKELFVAFAPLEKVGWSMGSVIESGQVLAALGALQTELDNSTRSLILKRILPVTGIIFFLVVILGLVLTNLITRPIQQLALAAERIGVGQWEAELPPTHDDEIGILSDAFKAMAGQLRGMVLQLERRVAERTHDLELRSGQLQAAAEVGRAVAHIRDLDQLLPHVTRLLSKQFGFYHVGIFLLDEKKEFAVLRAANSEGGQRMLARGHHLKVGEQGIVGYVTATKEARIALDVGRDAVFFNNPDLPDTHSEIALPLIAGDQLLGALDMQSTQPAAITKEDLSVLSVVADTVAVAIENAYLFAENQVALERIRRAYNEMSREAWEKLLRPQPGLGYVCTADGVVFPTLGSWSPKIYPDGPVFKPDQIIQPDGHTLAIPIKIREHVAGVIRFRKSEQASGWTAAEVDLLKKLTEQLGVALESARLFSETQRRAERERLVTTITTRMRATNDPEIILQTAVQELRQALQDHQAQISFQTAAPTSSDNPPGNSDQQGDH